MENRLVDLQSRLCKIAEAAKQRNPNGFVDRTAARLRDGDAEEKDSIFKKEEEPRNRLEAALMRGDLATAFSIREKARNCLATSLADGVQLSLDKARQLVDDGASLKDLPSTISFAKQSDDVVMVLALPALAQFQRRPSLLAAATLDRSEEFHDLLIALVLRQGSNESLFSDLVSLSPQIRMRAALRCLSGHAHDAEERERTLLTALRSRRASEKLLAGDWTLEMATERFKRSEEERIRIIASAEHNQSRLIGRVNELEQQLRSLHISTSSQQHHQIEQKSILPSSDPKSKARTNGHQSNTPWAAVVARIRKERLLDIDLDTLPVEIAVGARALQTSIAAAAKRLSHDLYQKKAHFVLEILANADDARYESRPVVHLKLSQKNVFRAHWNEIGFNEAELCALCDISRSTKGEHDYGTTGHKGIGFKACFAACAKPRLFSTGGLAVVFDTEADGSMGLVAPRLLPDETEVNGTVVELELRPDASQAVRSCISDIDNTFGPVLLFSRRLREVKIEIEGNDSFYAEISITASKQEVSSSQAQICTLSIIKSASNSKKLTQQYHYLMWSHSEHIVIAFPLDAEERHFYAHCVAPVERQPLKVSIQAPFEVVAARSAIKHASAHNVALRAELRDAIVNAIQSEPKILAKRVTQLMGKGADTVGFYDHYWKQLRDEIWDALSERSIPCIICNGSDELISLKRCLRLPQAYQELAAALDIRNVDDLYVITFSEENDQAVNRACAGEFTLHHLIEWLRKHPEAIVKRRDLLFQVLLDAEPAYWSPLRTLALFEAADNRGLVALDDGLFALSFEDEATSASETLKEEELATLDIFIIGKEATRAEREFLSKHGGLDMLTLEATYRFLLDRLLTTNSTLDTSRSWLVLDVLRRYSLYRSLDDAARRLVKIPSADKARPVSELTSPLFLGSISLLPSEVSARIDALLEYNGESQSTVNFAFAPPLAQHNQVLLLDWEAFFDQQLGLNRRRADSVSSDTLAQAAMALSSAEFWKSVSDRAVDYLRKRFMTEPDVLALARSLPALSTTNKSDRLEDLFARDVFYPLAGEALPYMFSSRDERRDGLPELATTAFSNRREVIAKLINGALTSTCIANALPRLITNAAPLSVFAALYAKCDDLKALLSGDVARIAIPYPEQPGTTPKLSLVPLHRCVWDDEPGLCELSSAIRLASHYEHSLGAHFIAAGLSGQLGSIQDLLATLANIAKGADEYSRAFSNNHQAAWSTTTEAMRRLARACKGNLDISNQCANAFLARRIILVPKLQESSVNGGAQVLHLIALSVDEAFWKTSTHAQSFALSRHYDAELKSFFIDVLGCKHLLERIANISGHRDSSSLSQSSSAVQHGLVLDNLLPSSTQFQCEYPQIYSERLVSDALGAVRGGDARLLPPQVARPLDPLPGAVALVVDALGVPRHALAYATSVRGCSFALDGCLVLTIPTVNSPDVAFIAGEVAHALAHLHTEAHSARIQAILSYALPRLAFAFAGPMPLHSASAHNFLPNNPAVLPDNSSDVGRRRRGVHHPRQRQNYSYQM